MVSIRATKSIVNPGFRLFVKGLSLAVASLAAAAPASATVSEMLSTTTSYIYNFDPALLGGAGATLDTFKDGFTAGGTDQATDIKLNYTTVTTSNASFFFMHNIQCKGYCSVSVTTLITDVITNNGTEAVNLRLDSDITAGHLGLVRNSASKSAGLFQFDITQTTSGLATSLYQAVGQVSKDGATITTSDGSSFSNLTSYTDEAQFGLDWDQTDLSVLLGTLAPGASTTVTYRSLTSLQSYGVCSDVTYCDGVQVAFGDPRNNGGVFGRAAEPIEQPVGFVLDRGFDGVSVKLDIVKVAGVPEPGVWAMMVMGFGLTGAALRRRRTGMPIAA